MNTQGAATLDTFLQAAGEERLATFIAGQVNLQRLISGAEQKAGTKETQLHCMSKRRLTDMPKDGLLHTNFQASN